MLFTDYVEWRRWKTPHFYSVLVRLWCSTPGWAAMAKKDLSHKEFCGLHWALSQHRVLSFNSPPPPSACPQFSVFIAETQLRFNTIAVEFPEYYCNARAPFMPHSLRVYPSSWEVLWHWKCHYTRSFKWNFRRAQTRNAAEIIGIRL